MVGTEDHEFFGIAANLVQDEADGYLDQRLNQVDKWAEDRQRRGLPVDLRSLIDQVMNEPNDRAPVIVALCTAMWRLRERKSCADQ